MLVLGMAVVAQFTDEILIRDVGWYRKGGGIEMNFEISGEVSR
jgi:hypothetical protein